MADPNGPVDVPGAYNIVEATFHALGRTIENFKSGKGMEWGEHHPCLFHGTERFFRAGYNANLVTSWLPALDGVVEKLQRGARVADVGCGHHRRYAYRCPWPERALRSAPKPAKRACERWWSAAADLADSGARRRRRSIWCWRRGLETPVAS